MADISATLGFAVGKLPFIYLGLSLFKGKPKKCHLLPIVARVKLKLSSWKGSLLSSMGGTQLVKYVVHSMLIYSFHIYEWPASLLKSIDIWIKNVIWSRDNFKRKLVIVAWSKVCNETMVGGLGVISVIKLINKVAILKLGWEMVSSDSQWSKLFRARFFKHKSYIAYRIRTSIWPGLRSCINMFWKM